jgi:hypothetical protein
MRFVHARPPREEFDMKTVSKSRIICCSLIIAAATGCDSGLPAAGPAGLATSGTANRAIQEADIYKLVGSTLYILNATLRGLQIVDVTDPLKPTLAGTVLVTGSPRQIYVEGKTAYVLVSGAFDVDCGGYKGICGWEAPSGVSTLVLAVDVSNLASPKVLGQKRIDGDLQDSRIVGNILYVVADTDTQTAVASLDVTDPTSFIQVAEIDFPFQQWDVGVFSNVTETRIIIAGAGDDCDAHNDAAGCSESTSVTQFTPIDITDPGGKMVQGTAFVGNGIVMDRWAMDFDPKSGIFRALLSQDSPHVSSGGGSLVNWSAPTVQTATKLGELPFALGNNITAAAFASTRVYVSSVLDDKGCPAPLALFDTTDPSMPASLGSVTVPGVMDLLYPFGQQLVGFGHADSSCDPVHGSGQLAVSLVDVAEAGKPSLLSQVTFGDPGATVAASRSDLKKAFLVLEDMGLILVPFQNTADMADPGGAQLIDLAASSLTLRGSAAHTGLLERAFPVQKDLAAFSDQVLQIIDIGNRDAPSTVAHLDLM